LDPLYTVIYPELSRLIAELKFAEVRHLLKRISVFNFVISLSITWVFYFFGEGLISLMFTSDYLVGLPMIQVYLLSVLVGFTFFYLQPLMLSFELEASALLINALASFVYIGLLLFMVPKLELWAIVIAFAVFTLLVTLPKIYVIQRKTKLFSRS
jgi:O-antigen/teichoic acid export membrane protein